MKTKAFSKEGLTQAAKLDPKEQEKEEIMNWLQTKVEELQLQIEQAEAEIESLQGSGKKRGKTSSAAGRLEELEHLNDRRKWHISRLEIVLRLLNNGSLQTEKATALKDDVAYFVESNTVRIASAICPQIRRSFACRKKISMSMKGYMTSSILMRKKRNSVAWYMTMMKVTSRTMVAKVCWPHSPYIPCSFQKLTANP